MRNKTTKVSIFGTLLIALFLYASMTVWAVNIDTYGETVVYRTGPPYCDASVNPWTFGNLDITPPVDITIYFHLSWSDSRDDKSSTATHYFNITADYDNGAQYDYEDYEIPTDGQDFDTHDISVTITNPQEGKDIVVTLLAEVTVSSPYCYAQDYNETTIHLV
jgi:hypothetical protein